MEDNIVRLLDENDNFHLKIKSIQITDDNLLRAFEKILNQKGYTTMMINKDDIFINLKKAYDNNIDYILIDEKIDILLPLVVVVTNDYPKLIKPTIPVVYLQKDNRIIQKIKYDCNCNYTTCKQIKNENELFDELLTYIGGEKQ